VAEQWKRNVKAAYAGTHISKKKSIEKRETRKFWKK
jgi:hypothetical protein